jgi:hypothetical protein
MKLRSGDILFFLHIPKTAGTSFNAILTSQFAPEEICPFPYEGFTNALRQTPSEALMKYRLMQAHCKYSIFRLLPRPPIFITMLRDPIQRFISTYHHILRDSTHQLHKTVARGALPLHEFVKHSSSQIIHNQMVRRLASGAESLGEQAQLEVAQSRLSEMAFFGLTERFEDSIKVLGGTFGWHINTLPHLNAAPSKHTYAAISDEVLDDIRMANSLDAALYEFGKALFVKRFAEVGL